MRTFALNTTISLIVGFAPFQAVSSSTEVYSAYDHKAVAWASVLKDYTNESGDVNYRQLYSDIKKQEDEHLLTIYLKQLQGVSKKSFDAWSRHEQMAFLINAYNAFTLQLIIDHFPVKSIRDINTRFLLPSRPWDVEFFSLLDGEITSIDPIEHTFLRPMYKDYRIHAAVNCASVSCPPLRRDVYVAEKLDEQLSQQMRLWIADPSRNRFDADSGTVEISKIFDWYKDDFEKWGDGLKTVLERYGGDEVKQALQNNRRIRFLSYDWSLNSTD